MVTNTQQGKRLSGFFRGKVKKHLPFGKCKIWIPGVYPEEFKDTPDQLPDAEQASPFFCGANFGNGVFSYPNINTTVWCFFQNEDQNYPVYFAATIGSSFGERGFNDTHQGEMDETTGTPFPYIHEIKAGKTTIKLFDGGQVWIMTSGSDGKACIKMNPDGTIDIQNDSTLQIHSNNVKMIATETFEVDAKNIIFSAADQLNQYSKNTLLKSTEFTTVESKRNTTGEQL